MQTPTSQDFGLNQLKSTFINGIWSVPFMNERFYYASILYN